MTSGECQNRDGNPLEDRHRVIVKELPKPSRVDPLALHPNDISGGRPDPFELLALALERIQSDDIENRLRQLQESVNDRSGLPDQDLLARPSGTCEEYGASRRESGFSTWLCHTDEAACKRKFTTLETDGLRN